MNELTETEVETVANSVESTLYSNVESIDNLVFPMNNSDKDLHTVTAGELNDYCIQLEQIANSSTALIKIFRQLQAAKLAAANK